MPRLATMNDVPTTLPSFKFPDVWEDPVNSFWKRRINLNQVDLERTEALQKFTGPVELHAGNKPTRDVGVYGIPYNIIDNDDKVYPVWDVGRYGLIPWPWVKGNTFMPLPDLVLREADPHGLFDMKYIGYDPATSKLYEAIMMNNSWFPFRRWQMGYEGLARGLATWDCTKPWNAPGQPQGVIAAKLPHLPLILKWHEFVSGRVDHAIAAVFENYNPGRTGPARGSDGTWADHPVRGGERLRLRADVAEQVYKSNQYSMTDQILAWTLAEYGIVCVDKYSFNKTMTGRVSLTATADVRFNVGEDHLQPPTKSLFKLNHFEIVQQ